MSVAKVIAMFASAFFPKLPKKEPKVVPDLNICDIWDLLSFVSVDLLLAKVFLIVVVCLVVRNNSCGNSSSSTFFLFNVNTVPALFFAAHFDLFNSAFFSLTLASW